MLNAKIDEAMLMYLSRATANENLNAKAKEFAEFFRCFGKTLATEEEFELFHGRLEAKIEQLNEKYPRTKPFELYGSIYHHLHVVPVGKPEQTVAHAAVHEVKRLIDAWHARSIDGHVIEINVK